MVDHLVEMTAFHVQLQAIILSLNVQCPAVTMHHASNQGLQLHCGQSG